MSPVAPPTGTSAVRPSADRTVTAPTGAVPASAVGPSALGGYLGAAVAGTGGPCP